MATRSQALGAGRLAAAAAAAVICLSLAAPAHSARVFLNPSDQTWNSVCGGGNEAQFALDMANLARAKIEAGGHSVIVDQSLRNAPSHANSWGADVFVSIHTNAGGGHGIETLYKTSGGQNLASHVNTGIVNADGHSHTINRGLKYRSDLFVLNATNMVACLTEALFHDCCSVEAPYLRTAGGRDTISTGIRNGVCSYVGGCDCTGPCRPGQAESRACCDCGTQQRACQGNCQWGGWGACAGPDPDGGNRACDTGELGPCAEGRVRCVSGCHSCTRLFDPAPEVCDGVDNDCSGEIDQGRPQSMGETPPPYAAVLKDFSFPSALETGERAAAWAEFDNVGTEAWRRAAVWLGALGPQDGSYSAFYAEGSWPAWDTAAVLAEDTPPGRSAMFSFVIEGPPTAGREASETFRLVDPEGNFMNCPDPEILIDVLVTPGSD
ncbi:MAG: N-acetylmuramoyl-L-alanine amidase, partial [Pseudomonadota bacterium]